MGAKRTADSASALSRGQELYQRMRADIGLLRLKAGTALIEQELSDRYAASRTPVREALFRLEQDGFVSRQGRQLYVRTFGIADIEDLYQIREALEKMAVRLCIERATNKQLDELRDQIDKYESIHRTEAYEIFVDFTNGFHWSMAKLSGNAALFEQLLNVAEKVNIITAKYMEPRTYKDAAVEHMLILQAIYDRDVMVAEAAIRVHIQQVIKFYKTKGMVNTALVNREPHAQHRLKA